MKWTTGRKERSPKEILGRMKTRTFRVGGYSVAATIIVAAIAVFANVFIRGDFILNEEPQHFSVFH